MTIIPSINNIHINHPKTCNSYVFCCLNIRSTMWQLVRCESCFILYIYTFVCKSLSKVLKKAHSTKCDTRNQFPCGEGNFTILGKIQS